VIEKKHSAKKKKSLIVNQEHFVGGFIMYSDY